MKLPEGVRIMNPLGYYDFNCLSKNAWCLLADSGTTCEEGLFFKVPCVSLRKTTERFETVEAGAHIIAGIDPQNICDSVETVTRMEWGARYDLGENFAPSNVVVNAVRSNITNFF